MTDLIRFAHRGAPARGTRGNSLAAYAAALRNGANGLEGDVRLTADGVPVLFHGLGRLHGVPLRRIQRADLPAEIPSLAELWQRCGTQFELALDMAEPQAVEAVIDLARRYDAMPRLWLTYWRIPTVAAWRQRWPEVKLVYPTFFAFPTPVLRRTARRLDGIGVDALNLHYRIIGRGSVAATHAAGLKLFAWGLRRRGDVRRVTALGVDGVFIDDLG